MKKCPQIFVHIRNLIKKKGRFVASATKPRTDYVVEDSTVFII